MVCIQEQYRPRTLSNEMWKSGGGELFTDILYFLMGTVSEVIILYFFLGTV